VASDDVAHTQMCDIAGGIERPLNLGFPHHFLLKETQTVSIETRDACQLNEGGGFF